MLSPVERSHISPVTGWQLAAAPPDDVVRPGAWQDLDWVPADVPGTVAGALRRAGRWDYDSPRDLDGEDWWFRADATSAPAEPDEEVVLRVDGVATVAELFIAGERRMAGESMFARHRLDIGRGLDGAEVAIRCCALTPLLGQSRRPRARWRTRVAAGGLRHYRTMLLGRAPGFAPGPPCIGPWRPVAVERRRHVAVSDLRVRARLDGGDGHLAVSVHLRGIAAPVVGARIETSGPSDVDVVDMHLEPAPEGGVRASARVRVPDAEPWWPHTHGEPARYRVRIVSWTRDAEVDVGDLHVGFRRLDPGGSGHDVDRDGLDLRVNGVPVFVRGAVWTPWDLVSMAPTEAALRSALLTVRDAGMNMLRIPGTAAYESPFFHELCDEIGVLVWQDLMFANFDYPSADPAFLEAVDSEVSTVFADGGSRPSLAVVCGNSEVEQQAAMFGADPAMARGELFGTRVPGLLHEADIDAIYVPSAPCGGDMPFRPGSGIANYFGVGGYRRPLSDVRAAEVRFAAECLAFANLPDADEMAGIGVARDAGEAWDFADVRRHYVDVMYGPGQAAGADRRALEQMATGEVMAEVFGEWRRGASTCHGGLVLWLKDVRPGAGWGLLDHHGEPKAALGPLRRALAPIAAWLTDEGLGGMDVHVANDGPQARQASLRVALYRDMEILVDEATLSLVLQPHTTARWGVEELIGRFLDVSYAYRFGPPACDLVVASLEDGSGRALSQAVRYPAGRPTDRSPAVELGLQATGHQTHDGTVVRVSSRRLAHGVRLHVPSWAADDDVFPVEPGHVRAVTLRPLAGGASALGGRISPGRITAANLDGAVGIDWSGEP